MEFCRKHYRYRIQQMFAIAIIFFTSACVVQILSVPSASMSESTLALNGHTYPSVLEDSETNNNDEILRFHSVPEVEIATDHRVVLRGAKKLPGTLGYHVEEEKDRFRYRLQPSRLTGENGLLATREFQGNSWSGTFMKGALVFFVRSSVPNYKSRAMHRATWACVRDVEGWKIEVVFVVGEARTPQAQKQLFEENKKYGDILQYIGSDKDGYATLKVLSGMQWAATRLPHDFYYASVSDKVLVNIEMVRDRIDSDYTRSPPPGSIYVSTGVDGSSVTSSQPQTVYCLEEIFEPEGSNQNSSQRWWSMRTQPQVLRPVWPPYCSDGLYVFPVSLAAELNQQWLHTDNSLPDNFNHVLVTGVLRRKLNRGDENIADALGHSAVVRFDFSGRAHRAHPISGLPSFESQLHVIWASWYKSISKRYHIVTYEKNRT